VHASMGSWCFTQYLADTPFFGVESLTVAKMQQILIELLIFKGCLSGYTYFVLLFFIKEVIINHTCKRIDL